MRILVQTDLFDHPKTIRFASMLGRNPTEAAGYLVRFWAWVARFRPEGNLADLDDREISAATGWAGRVGKMMLALRESGWIAGDRVHDWDEHQGSYFRRLAADRERKRRDRAADPGRTVDGPPANRQRTASEPPGGAPDPEPSRPDGENSDDPANGLSWQRLGDPREVDLQRTSAGRPQDVRIKSSPPRPTSNVQRPTSRRENVRASHDLLARLWDAAPPQARRRSSKDQAKEALKKVGFLENPSLVVKALESWCSSPDWVEDGGKYIPGLHLWIKRRQWENVPEAPESQYMQPPPNPDEWQSDPPPIDLLEQIAKRSGK